MATDAAKLTRFERVMRADEHISVCAVRKEFTTEKFSHYRPVCVAIRAGRLDMVEKFMMFPEFTRNQDAVLEATRCYVKSPSDKAIAILKCLIDAGVHVDNSSAEVALASEDETLMSEVRRGMTNQSSPAMYRYFREAFNAMFGAC